MNASGTFGDPRAVVVRVAPASYPAAPPFDATAGEAPHFWRGVRKLLEAAAPQASHEAGGLLSWLVKPGDTVVLKPNLICEGNWARGEQWQEVVTHPAVVRALADAALEALGGRGRLVIADGPQTDADIDVLLQRSGLGALISDYRNQGAPVEFLDLRRDRWFTRGGVTERREELPGDPAGYVKVDLGERSAFASYRLSGRFYGADYDIDEAQSFHKGGRHEYIVGRTIMASDVFINIPKLKTHKKTGVTLSLKNAVGVNGYRNCLPHYTLGSPAEGGDEFPDAGVRRRFESAAVRMFKKALTAAGGVGGAWARLTKRAGRAVFGDTARVIRSGNWEGNDTAWRMVLDLNQVLLWYDGDGRRRDAPRRYLSIVDGIIGGEGDGPLSPDPVSAGLLVAGTNPWAVDWAACREMGVDPKLIPMLQRPLEDRARFQWLLPDGEPVASVIGERPAGWRPFRPHFGWPGLTVR